MIFILHLKSYHIILWEYKVHKVGRKLFRNNSSLYPTLNFEKIINLKLLEIHSVFKLFHLCNELDQIILFSKRSEFCWKFLDYIGLHCGRVPPPPLCVCSIANTVGASPPWCVFFHWKTIFGGSLFAAYSALQHFFLTKLLLNPPTQQPPHKLNISCF